MRLLALMFLVLVVADVPSPDVTSPPPYADFLVIPLRVHVLTAGDLPEVDCKLSDDDVRRIIGKVNAVWHPAGVHWGLESIVREPASHRDRFTEAREKAGPRASGRLDLFRLLMPDESRLSEGLNVYYIHKFAVNGVYLGNRVAFVQETAALRPVPGGIDEPIPRVTAHELGHALGLAHRQDRTNLLASGTTGTILNQAEVDKARAIAKTLAGARTVPELLKTADATTDPAQARPVWSWLAEIPGEGQKEAIRKRDKLSPE